MKRTTVRRIVWIAAGAAALAAATGAISAQSLDMRGAILFADGKAIPAGQIVISLEGYLQQDPTQRRVGATHITSNGVSREVGFTFTMPKDTADLSALQIVVRLERDDGWLLARGRTKFVPGTPVNVTLNNVIY